MAVYLYSALLSPYDGAVLCPHLAAKLSAILAAYSDTGRRPLFPGGSPIDLGAGMASVPWSQTQQLEEQEEEEGVDAIVVIREEATPT
mmetsp:Transcript_20128/g.34276  ORF Transcript_20128/g.34276 Transcript_20128/m.34276 type:complete len:88 (+) Transcript_20128:399-662(+)